VRSGGGGNWQRIMSNGRFYDINSVEYSGSSAMLSV
jgi:hypothetical protein